jgi:hypothetical protein
VNSELKQKWILALRSGEYRQGKYRLRDEQSEFCCLGVLADVCGVEWAKKYEGYHYPKGEVHIFYMPTGFSTDRSNLVDNAAAYSTGSLSYDFREEIGLPTKEHDILQRMNDADDQSFEQIAAYIEGSESI